MKKRTEKRRSLFSKKRSNRRSRKNYLNRFFYGGGTMKQYVFGKTAAQVAQKTAAATTASEKAGADRQSRAFFSSINSTSQNKVPSYRDYLKTGYSGAAVEKVFGKNSDVNTDYYVPGN